MLFNSPMNLVYPVLSTCKWPQMGYSSSMMS
jgi:hypothetical protein